MITNQLFCGKLSETLWLQNHCYRPELDLLAKHVMAAKLQRLQSWCQSLVSLASSRLVWAEQLFFSVVLATQCCRRRRAG